MSGDHYGKTSTVFPQHGFLVARIVAIVLKDNDKRLAIFDKLTLSNNIALQLAKHAVNFTHDITPGI
ncbi:hypothetical protein FJN17_01125 [Bradyrhizobium symbiodeficiens]|uniref:Uncharacterized protein n=1 Tax=Bradyrhizobium symbiodeficiens TaxID=1404367 RepID=A0ABX5VZL7_9BRAD|nr:hypothetical protein [Bradyrhizobium symbiodeficiens]QDF36269.1 hypothetical protein FJN17_01125 [Bradyrhizobium symbiodeficiens]